MFHSSLENLKILNLKNNQIRRVHLVGLSKLKEINLENNQLESILEETFDSTLENLEVLNLKKNQIHSVQPNSINMLKNLREIYFEDNLLKEFEFEINNVITDPDDIFRNNPINLRPCQNFGYINEFFSIYFHTFYSRTFIVKPILNRTNMSKLIHLCEFSVNQKWKRIYRASEDYFWNFHPYCDDKPNTLVIIKSKSVFKYIGELRKP